MEEPKRLTKNKVTFIKSGAMTTRTENKPYLSTEEDVFDGMSSKNGQMSPK